MNASERILQHELEGLRLPRPGLHYAGPADFVIREGRNWTPARIRRGVRPMPPRRCYANAILVAVEHDVEYVEGFALDPLFGTPVHHAWNVRGDELIDATWRNRGLAYRGVVFSVERADDCTWNGDASVLDDFHRGWPLLRQPWTGEDFDREWPASERLDVIRAGVAKDTVTYQRLMTRLEAEARTT